MKMVTISEAKSKLSALIEAAEAGEEILIFRGSRPAVMLRPVSEDDITLAPEFSQKALDSFEREIERDRKTGRLQKLGDSPASAASTLRKLKPCA